MSKIPRITIKQFRDGSPWEIASQLGIQYTGDLNYVPHGGTFYETTNWAKWGYAHCVRIFETEGTLWVESGRINKTSDLPSALNFCGWEIDSDGNYCQNGECISDTDAKSLIEIESCLTYWGMDRDSLALFHSDNGKDWGDFPEYKIAKYVRTEVYNNLLGLTI